MVLKERAVIRISGTDRHKFLQGLITNDINKVSAENAIYALMLTPQGKFLYDFFIINHQDSFLLDCQEEYKNEILQKLNFYKFRSQIEISNEENLAISALSPENCQKKETEIFCQFTDPRNAKLGIRIIHKKPENYQNSEIYQQNRINLKIAETVDLGHGESFPLEFGFDDLNAIDYTKGCYVGQEVTARTHHRGLIRKKIFLLKTNHKNPEDLIGQEIYLENQNADGKKGAKKIGKFLPSFFIKNETTHILALLKFRDNTDSEYDLTKIFLPEIKNSKISLI